MIHSGPPTPSLPTEASTRVSSLVSLGRQGEGSLAYQFDENGPNSLDVAPFLYGLSQRGQKGPVPLENIFHIAKQGVKELLCQGKLFPLALLAVLRFGGFHIHQSNSLIGAVSQHVSIFISLDKNWVTEEGSKWVKKDLKMSWMVASQKKVSRRKKMGIWGTNMNARVHVFDVGLFSGQNLLDHGGAILVVLNNDVHAFPHLPLIHLLIEPEPPLDGDGGANLSRELEMKKSKSEFDLWVPLLLPVHPHHALDFCGRFPLLQICFSCPKTRAGVR